MLTGIAMQGQPDSAQWVTEYNVATSADGTNFVPYTDSPDTQPKVFTGNYDSNTVVKGFFDREVPAMAVRIFPVNWQGAVAMRLDMLTCNGVATLAPPLGQSTPSAVPTQSPPTLSPPFTHSPGILIIFFLSLIFFRVLCLKKNSIICYFFNFIFFCAHNLFSLYLKQ